MTQEFIRNFAIIAHVDHGKSTLSDRLLELTGTVPKEKMREQFLDQNPISRKRGITIKLAPVRMHYKIRNSNIEARNNTKIQNPNDQNHFVFRASDFEFADSEYILNLIDTPGHVDFSYEVSRTLAAVEGALLLVDATAGIQAQTLAHGLTAMEQNLVLIPLINKVDLANADIDSCKKQLMETFGFSNDEILLVSAKTGEGMQSVLASIIDKIPPPLGDREKPLRALIFDSFFDTYKGVVAQVRIVQGSTPKVGSPIVFLGTSAIGEILEVGYFSPALAPTQQLLCGEIGYIATGIKEPNLVRVGDTITVSNSRIEPLPGYKEVKPMVFIGFYPIESSKYVDLKEALEKFKLTDPAFSYQPEYSSALGAGFRCGFLGLLHAEVVQERLGNEFGVELIATAPSVAYLWEGKTITNPSQLPEGENIQGLQEPWVKMQIFLPQQYIGNIMELTKDRRGKFVTMRQYGIQVELVYELPLSDMVTDFYDRLKSVSSGFASLDWEFLKFQEVHASRVDILVAGERVDALSMVIISQKAQAVGRRMVERLKGVLPRQNFEVAIQAAIGGKIIARETVSAYRKDVIAKLYGGDRTRKDKLLDKQKKGKRKMKMVGKVEIPQEAFLTILKN